MRRIANGETSRYRRQAFTAVFTYLNHTVRAQHCCAPTANVVYLPENSCNLLEPTEAPRLTRRATWDEWRGAQGTSPD
ncbi:MAG: hypothetical protein KME57_24110 [Scytonema hyalinum WJT4-NPBG1]|nr:hypothetical protein [Scytonema hyalinum WJT4-NPBG1]